MFGYLETCIDRMTREQFKDLLSKKIVILDGATGSNLQKAGMPFGVCPEQWIVENLDALKKLQGAYAQAGSDIVYAPTFGGNKMKLQEYDLSEQAEYLNKRLVAISKEAVGGNVLVAGDLTMTGQQLEPLGDVSVEELIGVYKEQATYLAQAGADLLVIETMMSLAETRAAIIGAKEACDLPVMVTMSFGENGKTLYGTDSITAVEVIQGLGVDALGVNCSAGPDKMLPIIKTMAQYAKIPLIAKPNAGMPSLGEDDTTTYDMEPETFADYMIELVEAGAAIVGGCCGTTPEYIEKTVLAVKEKKAIDVTQKEEQYLTTERRTVKVEDTLEIGYIDAKTNEELAEDYANREYDTLMDLLDEQMDEEVDVICLCVDGEGIDGVSVIRDVILEANQIVNVPLAFSSRNTDVLEAALRAYPGCAGIVSEGSNEETIKELCRKYGAVIIR